VSTFVTEQQQLQGHAACIKATVAPRGLLSVMIAFVVLSVSLAAASSAVSTHPHTSLYVLFI
jgi:hypothetical protein